MLVQKPKWRRAVGHWLLSNLTWLGFAVALVLGVVGFWIANEAIRSSFLQRFFDSLYRSIQMFGLNFEMPVARDGTETPVNLWLHAARTLAGLVAFYAVVSVFFGAALESLFRWFQIQFRPQRHVLLGFGEINRAVAAELRDRKPAVPVTAVDRSFDDVDRKLAQDLRIRLLEGSLSDRFTLDRARIDRAGRVIVSTGDDIRSIEVANAVAPLVERGLWQERREGELWWEWVRRCRAEPKLDPVRPPGQDAKGHHRLWVHVDDSRLCSDLTEARDMALSAQDCFRPFNVKQEAARLFVTQARLVQRAKDHGAARVHLVIVGMGVQGEAILIETLMTSYDAGLLPPRITVLDKDSVSVEARLRAHYPFLMDGRLRPGADMGWHDSEGIEPVNCKEFDVTATSFVDCEKLDKLDDSNAPPTAWVFCCGDDQLNLAAAMRLEIAMQCRARRPRPIHVRSWRSGLSSDAPRHKDVFGLVQHFGDVRGTIHASDLLRDDGDQLAQKIHMAYQSLSDELYGPSKYNRDQGYRQDWLYLPEAVREANRRVARSLPTKLGLTGFSSHDLMSGRLVALEQSLSQEVRAGITSFVEREKSWIQHSGASHDGRPELTPSAESVEPLAREEHCAWIVERASKGWFQSADPEPSRDNLLRRQANMIPFSRLGPGTAAYDLVALKTALDAMQSDGPGRSAKRRKVGTFSLANGFPGRNAVKDLTDIELRFSQDAVEKFDTQTWSGMAAVFAQVLEGWSSSDVSARFHLILEHPIYMPTAALTDNEIAKATDPIIFLSQALAGLGPHVICDVTRRYQRSPVPKPPADASGPVH